MVKSVKRQFADDDYAPEIALSAAAREPKKAGRPPTPPQKGQQLSVSFTLIQTCWQALKAVIEQPESPSTRPLIAKAAQDLLHRCGPALETGILEPRKVRGRLTRGYTITGADGTTTFHATAIDAAKALGIKPASLRVVLSKGGGRSYHGKDENRVVCRRVNDDS